MSQGRGVVLIGIATRDLIQPLLDEGCERMAPASAASPLPSTAGCRPVAPCRHGMSTRSWPFCRSVSAVTRICEVVAPSTCVVTVTGIAGTLSRR